MIIEHAIDTKCLQEGHPGKLQQELVGQGLTADLEPLECRTLDQSLTKPCQVVNLRGPEINRSQRSAPQHARASIRKETPIERVTVHRQALDSVTRPKPLPKFIPPLQTREARATCVAFLFQLDRLQSSATTQGAEQRLVPLVKRDGLCAAETKVQVLQVTSTCQGIADEGNVAD